MDLYYGVDYGCPHDKTASGQSSLAHLHHRNGGTDGAWLDIREEQLLLLENLHSHLLLPPEQRIDAPESVDHSGGLTMLGV